MPATAQLPKTLPLATRRAMLEGRLIELGARLTSIAEELAAPHSPDWEDQATERETDEVQQATGHAGQSEIPQIRAALQRVADGSYGICTHCGARIAKGRLDALPWTPLCRTCAR
jgi:RNA polymerase-binding transcription factor DksA